MTEVLSSSEREQGNKGLQAISLYESLLSKVYGKDMRDLLHVKMSSLNPHRVSFYSVQKGSWSAMGLETNRIYDHFVFQIVSRPSFIYSS